MGALEAVMQMRQMEQQKAMQERALQEEIMNNAIGNIMNATKLQQNQAMMGLEKQKTQASIDSLVGETKAKQQQQDLLNQLIGGEGGQAGKPYIEGLNIGGMNVKIPKSQEQVTLDAQNKAQEESILAASKPLSAEAATRYSGVTQGVGNIKNIVNELSGKDIKLAKDLIYKANLGVNAASAKDTLIPGGRGIYQSNLKWRSGDKGLNLANEFLTLSENLLRARTGAQAPEPEIIREQARTLLNSWSESPETWHKKLKTNLDFLQGVGKEIRPNRQDEWGFDMQDSSNPDSQSLNFSSESEVNKANLPKGTIIFINGRKARVD